MDTGKFGPLHLGALPDSGQKCFGIGLGRRNPHSHGSALTQVTGQRPSVDATDAHDSLVTQVIVEAPLGPPVGWDARWITDDIAAHPDLARLPVLVVHAGVADMRSGHDHDLTVVRRIGQGLLITGHAGGEDRLTEGLSLSPVGLADEGPAIFQDQNRVTH